MTSTALHITAGPRHAEFYAFNCALCGHEELNSPVFLSDGNAYGTGCAALLLFGRKEATRQVRKEADHVMAVAVAEETARQERRDSYTAMLANINDGEATQRARKTFHQMGGFATLGAFPAWLARVATTGDLEAIA